MDDDKNTTPKKVLLVDDDSDFLAYFLSLIEDYNLFFDICSSLEVAKKKIQTATYDAYIIDLNLPGGSGLDLVQEIRNKKGYQCPIGVISGVYKDEHMYKLLKEKYFVEYVLDKPIYPEQIDDLLVNLCFLSRQKKVAKVDKLDEIRQKYIHSISDKLLLLSDLIANFEKNNDEVSLIALRDLIHKIAGSAGSYGFSNVSNLCKKLEMRIEEQIKSKKYADKELNESFYEFLKNIKYNFQFSTEKTEKDKSLLPSITRASIYVVDNDIEFLELLQREKEEFAIDLYVEKNPDTAIQRLKSPGFNPRIVASSQIFFESKVTAFDIFDAVKNKENAPLTLFSLILESDTNIDSRIDLTRKDIKYVFHKPISARFLLKTIADTLHTGILRHYKVLILDDDPDVCSFVYAALSEIGVEVRVIDNPSLLFQTLEEYAPHLLFLDLIFPEYYGLDLLKTLRSDVLYINLIVVVITAHNEPSIEVDSYAENADEVFFKPINKTILQKKVLNLAKRAAFLGMTPIDEAMGLGSCKMLIDRIHEGLLSEKITGYFALLHIENYSNLVLWHGQTFVNELMILMSNILQKTEDKKLISYFFFPYFGVVFNGLDVVSIENQLFDLLNLFRLQNSDDVRFSCCVLPISKGLGSPYQIIQKAKDYLSEISITDSSPIKIFFPLSQSEVFTKKQLVVIDSDEYLLSILKRSFEVNNFEVLTFNEGKKALEMLLNLNESELPNLIIAERKLPDMDGIEILKSLKKNYKLTIPFYFLTDYVSEKDVRQGLEYGALEYITKPFNLSLVVQRLIKKTFE